MTDTHPTADSLAAYAGHKLPAAETAAVGRHLDKCEGCRRRAEELKRAGETSPAGGTDLYAGLSQAVRGMADLPTVDQVPDELKGLTQYTDLKELGRGGMGVVYLARHALLDRPVVLKVASRELLAAAGGDAAERFLREMRSAAKLSHPNVVAAYDAFRHGEVLVFVMEYAPGEDLAKLLARKGPLPVPTACFYAHCVALGLQHAYEHKLVHRDIKPQNLIQVKTGTKATVKVLDFGLAKVAREAGGTGPTVANTGMGTPQYMAPEQWRDFGGVDIRADLYSLGCTLFCLLTRRPPFLGNQYELMQAHCGTPAPAVTSLRPDVPAELSTAVAKLLAKNPADRYQTPAEVAAVLREFIKPGAKPAPAVPPVPPAPPLARETTQVHESAVESIVTVTRPVPPRRRGRLWTILTAFALLNLLGGLLLYQIAFKTPNGNIVIENVPDGAEVVLDGSTATVSRNGETVTLTAMQGKHSLKVVQSGKVLLARDEVVVTVGGKPLTVRVEPPIKPNPNPSAIPEKQPPEPANAPVRPPEAVAGPDWKRVRAATEATSLGSSPDAWESFKASVNAEGGVYSVGAPLIRPQINKLINEILELRNKLPLSLYDNNTKSKLVMSILDQCSVVIAKMTPRGNKEVVKILTELRTKLSDEYLAHVSKSTAPQTPSLSNPNETWPWFSPATDFMPLFNGKNLTGWKTHPSQPLDWRVENGVLIGSGSGAISFLYTERVFSDFHLLVKFRVNAAGNSGIFFRAAPAPKRTRPDGYEAQINYSGRADPPTGSLYLAGQVVEAVTEPAGQPAQWCTYEVIAIGDVIELKVNGQRTARYVDSRNATRHGQIALQRQDEKTIIEFQKIDVKELPPTAP